MHIGGSSPFNKKEWVRKEWKKKEEGEDEDEETYLPLWSQNGQQHGEQQQAVQHTQHHQSRQHVEKIPATHPAQHKIKTRLFTNVKNGGLPELKWDLV